MVLVFTIPKFAKLRWEPTTSYEKFSDIRIYWKVDGARSQFITEDKDRHIFMAEMAKLFFTVTLKPFLYFHLKLKFFLRRLNIQKQENSKLEVLNLILNLRIYVI